MSDLTKLRATYQSRIKVCYSLQRADIEPYVTALEARVTGLEAEIERLQHSESVLNDMLNRQIDHTKEAQAEIDRLRTGLVDAYREAVHANTTQAPHASVYKAYRLAERKETVELLAERLGIVLARTAPDRKDDTP